MLSAGMLVSSLTLLLSLPVSVLFCLSPLGFAAWLWLLSWGLCPPGVLATTLGEYPAFFEDMRSMYAFAPGLSVRSCLYAGPQLQGFLLCFHSLYAVLLLCLYPRRGCRSMGYVYRATFVFCNSKLFLILYYLVFIIFFFFLTSLISVLLFSCKSIMVYKICRGCFYGCTRSL